jgi:hypothetical protein
LNEKFYSKINDERNPRIERDYAGCHFDFFFSFRTTDEITRGGTWSDG